MFFKKAGVADLKKPGKLDKKIIEYQLGREAENLGGIVKYCPYNKPALLLTLPYNDSGGVFPTTYWLSCPYLVKEVSRLEDQGLISTLTLRLKSDEKFRKELEKAHLAYAEKRRSLLGAKDIKILEENNPGILKVLTLSGVGGIRDKMGIKCLHTHLADFLAGGLNPVGKFVWKELGWPDSCHICDIGVDKNESWSD